MSKKMSTQELQIAERAEKYKDEPLTNLTQFITEGMLHNIYQSGLNKNSSSGVDGKYWHTYSLEAQFRLPELLSEFKSGKYRAPLIRRVFIPKGRTGKRPLGIPTIEDKILQESVRRVLTPIYEVDFKDFSYGFRAGRSAHQAVEYLFSEVSFKGLHYIIDADIKDFFGSMDHGLLRGFLDLRVKDGVIRTMVNKWLKAGILEGDQVTYPENGSPQGGLISPLLSNVYLHYVLDVWFSEQIQPLLAGASAIVRYADDFVLCFRNKLDAVKVMEVLPKRFRKYHLELHPDKTKIVNLNSQRGKGDRSFDFLGFTHYLGSSRKGTRVLKRKTSRQKLTIALNKTRDWIIKNRHRKLKEIVFNLNRKLVGHYSYYGITFNSRSVNSYYVQVRCILHKWLNRRGGKKVWNWARYSKLISDWLPLSRPKIYHSFVQAKPV
ncbi:MAG: group II intron reverse transcriptase/maturase [Carboxylicivirga sp.]|jgi:group II intron reverse transcriptase/maturase|nr:group II intron reverse transcriptase/maturase [Carboxylicivirga sp.]